MLGQLATAHTYRSVAEQLQLPPDTRGASLHGFVMGRRVWVGPQTRRTGSERLIAAVALAQPLGVGLTIQRESRWHYLKSRVSSLRVKAHVRQKPALLAITSTYPGVTKEVLDTPTRETLERMALRWPGLRITDYTVRVHLNHPIILQSTLHQLVLDLCRIANILEARRIASQPPPYAAALTSDWNRIAPAYNLTLEPNVPVLLGKLSDANLTVAPNAHGRTATINLVRNSPSDIGLLVSDQRRTDVANIAGQDIEIGEPLFDDAFIIKGYDPDQIRTLLDDTTCATLLRLKQISRVRIDDHALTLRNISVQSTTIAAAVDDLLVVNARLNLLLS